MDWFALVFIILIIALVSRAFFLNKPQKKIVTPEVAKAKAEKVKFFATVKQKLSRDYTLIIDRSGSMSADCEGPNGVIQSRWDEARQAVAHLAPNICEIDPDGITIYLFSTGQPIKFQNVCTPEDVRKIFNKYYPSGGTDLAGVLEIALDAHFETNTQETILVITDGWPNDSEAVKRTIIAATQKLSKDEDLSISMIQIGNDAGAKKFLECLDDDLVKQGAKFDIVDTLDCDFMKQISFSELIHRSILDWQGGF